MVRLIFFEQSIGCEMCAPTRRVLEQIAADNPDVTLDVLNLVLDKEKAAEYGVDRVPAIIVAAAEGERRGTPRSGPAGPSSSEEHQARSRSQSGN